MNLQIISVSLDNLRVEHIIKQSLSTKCPFCSSFTSSSIISNAFKELNSDKLFTICKCDCCKKLHFRKYKLNKLNLEELNTYPTPTPYIEFHDHLKIISNDFLICYEQSLQAKEYGLNEIVGMGLRKSLEILVTDYIKNVLNLQPANTLKDKISQINISNVRISATLARWIGNDETHIEKKCPDLDIDYMIKCIDNVVYYLCQEYNSIKFEEDLNNHLPN